MSLTPLAGASGRRRSLPTNRGPGYYAFSAGFVLAAGVTALAIFLTTAAPGANSIAFASRTVLPVLGLNLILVLILAAAVGWRALSLFKNADAAVRLHRRFVGLFALAAVAPAIIVALFFGLLV